MTRHLLKPREAAEQLRLTEGQVRDLIRKGRLASIRVGKRSYVPSDAPDRFLSEANACHDETLAPDSNGIPSGAMEPTTSHGAKQDAAGSAALALALGRTLKSVSPRSSGQSKRAHVIRGKFS